MTAQRKASSKQGGKVAVSKKTPVKAGSRRGKQLGKQKQLATLAAAATLLNATAAGTEPLTSPVTPGASFPVFSGRAQTEPVSERELQRLKYLRQEDPTLSLRDLAKALQRSPETVRKYLLLLESPPPASEGQTPVPDKGGRPAVVTPEMVEALRNYRRMDPTSKLNFSYRVVEEQLGVRRMDDACWRRALQRRTPEEAPMKKRRVYAYTELTPQELDMQLEFVQAVEAACEEHGEEILFYQDETHFIPGIAPKEAVCDRDVHMHEKNGRHGSGEKVSIWGVIGNAGIIHLWVTTDAGDDATCERYFCGVLHDAVLGAGKNVFECIPQGAILIGDRLGRSGRCKHPTAGHYNPKIKATASAAGRGYLILPPHGALLNPIEVVWAVLKAILRDMQPPGEPRDSFGHIIRGSRTLSEMKVMLPKAVEELNHRKGLFKAVFQQRAHGEHLLKRYSSTDEAKEILQRAENKRAGKEPFNLHKAAFAPRLLNNHCADAEPLTTTAQKKSYVRYWMLHVQHGTHAGLPPPGPAGKPGRDGAEDKCRVCFRLAAPTGDSGLPDAERDTLLVCEHPGCTASYHMFCLGLNKEPRGKWTCPGCKNAPGVKPRWELPGAHASGGGLLDDSD